MLQVWKTTIKEYAGFVGRTLTFRLNSDDFDKFELGHVAVGLILVWIVGYGRWWDASFVHNPIQRSGLGSVVYAIVLAGVLWLIGRPFYPESWRYRGVLTFVTCTSLPAALYAIPVERFMDRGGAVGANFWFLALVAAYRVAILIYFFSKVTVLSPAEALTCALLPIGLIAYGIVSMGLTQGVMDVMGGFRGTAKEEAYGIASFLSLASISCTPFALMYYIIIAIQSYQENRK